MIIFSHRIRCRERMSERWQRSLVRKHFISTACSMLTSLSHRRSHCEWCVRSWLSIFRLSRDTRRRTVDNLFDASRRRVERSFSICRRHQPQLCGRLLGNKLVFLGSHRLCLATYCGISYARPSEQRGAMEICLRNLCNNANHLRSLVLVVQ